MTPEQILRHIAERTGQTDRLDFVYDVMDAIEALPERRTRRERFRAWFRAWWSAFLRTLFCTGLRRI